MIEETLVRIRGIVLPRIEWFRLWFRLRRVQRQKDDCLVRLGRSVSEPSSEKFWPNTTTTSPSISAIVDKIRDLDNLEVKLREWLEYLEDREVSGVLAHLQEDLERRTLRTQTILISADSPYLGISIGDLRKNSPSDGTLPLTALRGSPAIEIGPGLPLGIGDRLVLLSVWKKLRDFPPSATIFEVDGAPGRSNAFFD